MSLWALQEADAKIELYVKEIYLEEMREMNKRCGGVAGDSVSSDPSAGVGKTHSG